MIDALASSSASSADLAGAMRSFTSWWNSWRAECEGKLARDAADLARKMADHDARVEADRREAEERAKRGRRGFVLGILTQSRPILLALLKYGIPALLAGSAGYIAAGGPHVQP